VPRSFQFDKKKNFSCHMLTDATCETPEEQWDDEEEFVEEENVDLIVDGGHYGSISTTPRSAHSDSSKRENSTRGSHEHGKSQRDYSHSQNLTNNSAGMSAAGERMLVSPRVYGADNDDGIAPAPFFLVFCFRHPRTAPTCAWGGGVKTDSFSTTTIRFLFVDAFPGPCLPDPWTCTYLLCTVVTHRRARSKQRGFSPGAAARHSGYLCVRRTIFGLFFQKCRR